MKFTSIFTTSLMILGSPAWAQETARAIPPASPETKIVDAESGKASGTVQAQIQAAIGAYDRESNAFMEKLRAEKDRNKQREMYGRRPNPSETVNLIVKLAEDHPKAEGVEDGLAWCLKKTPVYQLKKISDLLLTHYKNSQAIGVLASAYIRMPNGKDGLMRIIKEAGDEKVRQTATYYLASSLLTMKGSKAEGVAMMKKLREWPGIAENNPRLLASVKSQLFSIENLSVGSKAPDIVGTDQDDKEFKLSDYKGQVVLLDFWGFW